LVHGVVHYGVANMPALVPRTSTFALTNATLPYIVELANKRLKAALAGNPSLAKGLNVCRGQIVHPGVAESVNESVAPLEACLRD
jgi:alanine dehydrogenase